MVIRRRMNFRRAAVVKEGIVGGRVGEGEEHEAGQQLPERRRGCGGCWWVEANVERGTVTFS